ncbi:MAG: hypothetical protein Q4F88_02810 [Eubacteriales bacterium]|nr:hypothetical protein [Eubacteriales bacterium]
MIKVNNNKKRDKYMDYIHICIGIFIVVMAILALFNPNENMVLIPFIFLFSGMLYLLIFLFEILYTRTRVTKKMQFARLLKLIFSIFLFFMFVVSRIIIWS